MRRHVGLLVVHVMEGRDLKKMDAFGKADPFLELYTQPTCVEKTVKDSLDPSFGYLFKRSCLLAWLAMSRNQVAHQRERPVWDMCDIGCQLWEHHRFAQYSWAS